MIFTRLLFSSPFPEVIPQGANNIAGEQDDEPYQLVCVAFEIDWASKEQVNHLNQPEEDDDERQNDQYKRYH